VLEKVQFKKMSNRPDYADPELIAWLEKHDAHLIGEGVVGDQLHHLYAVNGREVVVVVYNDASWGIFIPAPKANGVSADFRAVELACRILPE
jgi:hypothetical protein